MQLTLAMQFFNEKLRQLNQSNGKQVVLPAKEARNLQADIFNLLAALAEFSDTEKPKTDEVINVNLDGGSFKQ
jgi:hypothetical protein